MLTDSGFSFIRREVGVRLYFYEVSPGIFTEYPSALKPRDLQIGGSIEVVLPDLNRLDGRGRPSLREMGEFLRLSRTRG